MSYIRPKITTSSRALIVAAVIMSVAISLWSNTAYLNSLKGCTGNSQEKTTILGDDDALPIPPRYSSDSLNSLFLEYTGKGGWIDVGALPASKVPELRQIAKGVIGDRDLQCGHPRVNVSSTTHTTTRTIIPGNEKLLKYCFWENDVVSSSTLNDFEFEQESWEWVAKSFQRLAISHQDALAANKTNCCERLAFLDIGVNVGDWISPIRLLAPHSVPIFGIEGSPATAAVAAANLKTSTLHNTDKANGEFCSKILPYTLATKAQIPYIHREGGVCFSKPEEHLLRGGISINMFNIGGRHITNEHISQCQKASDVAGATTLEHAIKSLCPNNSMPKVYILKIDIEGYEFKAISSVISSWLAKAPPCYFFMEIRNEYSYAALVETLLEVVGYNAVWRPTHKEYPYNTPPWMNGLTGTQNEVGQIMSVAGRGHTEIIFGFYNVGQCIDNLMNTN